MKCLPLISLGMAALLTALSCGKLGDGDERTLPTPRLLPPPDDFSEDERGLDAVPERDAIQVEWEVFAIQNASIQVWRRAEECQDFEQIGRISAKDTVFLDEDVEIGTRYWYFLIASADGWQDSAPSDTFSYRLLEKPFALVEIATQTPVFRWQVGQTPVGYVLKLFEVDTDKKVWFASVWPDYGTLAEEVAFNFDSTAAVDSLEPGKGYRWRVDVIGPEKSSGAESHWRVFRVP